LNKIIPPFNGFYKQTFNFLSELENENNNNTKWFSDNRDRYEKYLVLPSKAFVIAIGQFFNNLNPIIRTEPKFNKTLMRINKDIRFTRGLPYRDYFLIHFGKFKMDSEFYVYLNKNGIEYGLFINNTKGNELFFRNNKTQFKNEIINSFDKFNINGKFDLYELNKGPEFVLNNFNASKNFQTFSEMKFILIEKNLSVKNKIIYTADFLTETIKVFSVLYPIYCFAISSQPLKLLDEFEERMGIPI